MSVLTPEGVDFAELEKQFEDEADDDGVHIFIRHSTATYCGKVNGPKQVACSLWVSDKPYTPSRCDVCGKKFCPRCVERRRAATH